MPGVKGQRSGGRNRKSDRAKVLTGTFRPDRANPAEPEPRQTKKVPSPPAYLEPEAKVEWRRLARELHRTGILTIADRSSFAAYCQAWADYRRALAIIRAEGRILTTEKGYRYVHPAVGLASTAREAMRKFALEFGLTPASRPRVQGVKPERVKSAEEEAADRLLG